MTSKRYKIFQKLPSQRPMWVETATGLEDAKERLRELTMMFSADCFILDRENSVFIVPFDKPRAAD